MRKTESRWIECKLLHMKEIPPIFYDECCIIRNYAYILPYKLYHMKLNLYFTIYVVCMKLHLYFTMQVVSYEIKPIYNYVTCMYEITSTFYCVACIIWSCIYILLCNLLGHGPNMSLLPGDFITPVFLEAPYCRFQIWKPAIAIADPLGVMTS